MGHLNRYFSQPNLLSLKFGDQCSGYELGPKHTQMAGRGVRTYCSRPRRACRAGISAERLWMGSRGSNECPACVQNFVHVYWWGRVVRKEFTAFRFSKEFVNQKMVNELWYRACILKGDSISPQRGKNWFPGGKKSIIFYV